MVSSLLQGPLTDRASLQLRVLKSTFVTFRDVFRLFSQRAEPRDQAGGDDLNARAAHGLLLRVVWT